MSARASPLARMLLAIYGLLVAYASLHPFSGWHDPAAGMFDWIAAPAPRWVTAFDLYANVFAYLPLGLLAVLALAPAMRGAAAVLGAALAGALLSALLETAQVWLPSRIPSNLDLAANSAGALAGAFIGALWARTLAADRGFAALRHRLFREGGRVDFGLALLGLWLLAQLNPETLLFGLGDLRDLLPARAGVHYPAEVFIRVEAFAAALQTLAVGALLALLAAPRQPVRLLFLLLVGGALAVRTLAYAVLFSPQEALLWLTPGALFGMTAGTFGFIALAGLPRPALVALCGVSLMVATALVNLAPGNPYLSASLAVWRQGHFLNFNGLTRLLSAVWPFAAMACLLLLASARRPHVSIS